MMKPIDFYTVTEDMLHALAEKNGVSHLERYYELTDFAHGSFLDGFSGKAQIFVQVAFHAQNAALISRIVRFEKNMAFLKKACCGFEPGEFLQKYSVGDREKSIIKLVEDLRCDRAGGEGLKWNSARSRQENRDFIVRRYANTLIEAAAYIDRFRSRDELLSDLLDHYRGKDYKALISYFRSQITTGFSIVLTCDFLKEFDRSFCDLPKPDLHIKDTLCALYSRKENYYQGETKELECIKDMQMLTAEINRSLEPNQRITVYQLDRMIWLVCSGNFYLDRTGSDKNKYLKAIQGDWM